MQAEPNTCTFTATNFDERELKNLVASLNALGCEMTANVSSTRKTAKVSVRFPNKYDAEIMRTRRAGRRQKSVIKYGSIFDYETTVKDFLDWYDDGKTVEDAMRELNVTRSTFYRKLKGWREHVKERDKENERRRNEGLRELSYHRLW